MVSQAQNFTDSEPACAKLNLALHVRKRFPNGYHELETVFAFLNRGDVLRVSPAENLTLQISGPFAEDLTESPNLVMDAAELLSNHSSIRSGAALKLEKHLPVASGIGGGSADAAAALRLLNRFWKLDIGLQELADISATLGADVPACVLNRTCIGRGIGQDLVIADDDSLIGMPVLLVNPLTPVSTADIFNAWDGVDQGPIPGGDLMTMALSGSNGLTEAATALQPVVSEILNLLETTDPLLSRMSGSGATCFALYRGAEELAEAEAFLRQNAPDIWIMSGELK
ncbi:4-diphosphocytidyl-2-C-methyl-D-erythritol kinase [Parasphingorhabdus marina DSM 22363]|uniref:4-diphosphocytidyl-2-C-methyl-D-erythritol kinase n=1 Tax=Parasphingorhabdus marina DSM 22363 TaxID=1123272 RepID=A0A1N6FL41_9SPHN|nr:4-(cytidine 5'-diphospho)-2-C-methyl-D-erythritol kinase [Parasphingorhabdus marina]SIN95999.1 4-diphosphocytidyl-2-C-methyl-D-erythritol kinase [Parasphingorhabdus marina DSM 22363]